VTLVLAALAASAPGPPRGLPPLVLVERRIDPALEAAGVIPGLGPSGRCVAPGGRLLVREPDGRVRPLLPEGTLHDAADPCVSWDGRRVVFAGVVAPDSGWRIWVCGADGRGLAAVTRTPAAEAGDARRVDDLDPCWLPDDRIVFASTRWPLAAERGAMPVTNLWVVEPDGTGLGRVTAEREGAEEPSIDPRDGRVVYARWFFNRWRASDVDPSGITADPARGVPADTVDLWHALSVTPDGDGARLAGGDPRSRAGQQAYQPRVLADGTLVGVRAEHSALAPAPGRCVLQGFPGGFAAARPIAGEGATAGATAVAPGPLPDGRVVFSMRRPGGPGFALWVARPDGRGLARLLERDGAHLLDAAAWVARPRPPRFDRPIDLPPPARPPESAAEVRTPDRTFRFDCLNVFANAGVDAPFPDAPPIQRGLRIRFFAALARPAFAGGDTVVLVREEPLTVSGAVHVDAAPADVPMFEQLVDSAGRIVRAVAGPAHVPGFNFGRMGTGTKCVGCHAGHSALPVAESYFAAKWTNVAPSARVTASSVAAGTAGARAVADRRAAGPAGEVGWVAGGAEGEWVRLAWDSVIEVREVVLYALAHRRVDGTSLRVRDAELVMSLGGREAGRVPVPGAWPPGGRRVTFDPLRVDAIELRPLRATGRVLGRPAVGVAEIETLARLAED
jgi:hypothetical protein